MENFCANEKLPLDEPFLMQEGYGSRCVEYVSPPLPLMPPHEQHKNHTQVHQPQLTQLAVIPLPEDLRLLCFVTNGYSVSLCILSEQSVSGMDSFNGKDEDDVSFVEWNSAFSSLASSEVKTFQMSEEIKQLDSTIVCEKPYLCIACSHNVMIFEIPLCDPINHCKWINVPSMHKSTFKISHVKLSPYIPGQVLVITDNGELYVYKKEFCEIKVRVSGCLAKDSQYLCSFGSQPYHVLWVEGGALYSADLRTEEVPLKSSQKPLWARDDGGDIKCIFNVSHKPFHLLLGTSRYFVLVDLRDSENPLLLVPHHLHNPPSFITCLHASNGQYLVLLSSFHVNMIFCYQLKSGFSAQLITPPHSVCSLRDTLQCLKRSDLYVLACSQVNYRFTESIVGTALLPFSHDESYGALIVTKLGDIFYQFWKYTTSSSNPPLDMYLWLHLGLKLWLKEAYIKKLNKESSWKFPSTIRDMNDIAKYLISGEKQQCLKCYYNCQHSHTSAVSMADNPHTSSVSVADNPHTSSVSVADNPHTSAVSVADNPHTSAVSMADNSHTSAVSVADNPHTSAVSVADNPHTSAVSVADNPHTSAVSMADNSHTSAVSVADNPHTSAVSMANNPSLSSLTSKCSLCEHQAYGSSHLDALVRSCDHVIPTTKLDVALVTGWENDIIKSLFQDE